MKRCQRRTVNPLQDENVSYLFSFLLVCAGDAKLKGYCCSLNSENETERKKGQDPGPTFVDPALFPSFVERTADGTSLTTQYSRLRGYYIIFIICRRVISQYL